jgi:glycosyltransferase involved in cell wall biosynthesis
MNILFLSHDLPNPSNPLTFRVYYAAKYLTERHGHNITIAAFKEKKHAERYIWNLEDFSHLEIVEIPEFNSLLSKLVYVTSNMLSLQNLLSKQPVLFNFYYSPKMHRIVKDILKENIDIVFIDLFFLIPYVIDKGIHKVAEVWAEGDAYYNGYKSSKGIQKLYQWLMYNIIRRYENKYQKLEACITVTEDEREKLKQHFNLKNIYVIPYGVDIEYFKPANGEEEFPSLMFVGNMKTKVNELAITYFCNEILPIIQNKIPNIKLYIVGKDPTEKILKLPSDNIIITGYVDDVRPYYTRASIVILPIIKNVGFRTRLLEAMAMGKPVVATSTAIGGIDVTPNENIIITNNSKEFAEHVIQLLNDKNMRHKIGENARRLMEEKYSWKIVSEKFYEVLLNVIDHP